MHQETVTRVAVWSGPLRTLHWALGLAALALVISGWLMSRAAGVAAGGEGVAGLHRNVGYLLLAALAVRGYLLLFGQGPAHWRDFVPWPPQHQAALATLRLYLTLGRSPLPAYYAHNPLWGPVYLAFYGFLAFQGLTGLTGLAGPHRAGLGVATAFIVAHVVAVFVHDWKGAGADVSAMINGYRVFLVRRPGPAGAAGVQAISVDALTRRRPAPRP